MISEKIPIEQVLEAGRMLNNASTVVILTHMSPDGDALGSALGLASWLRSTSPLLAREEGVSVVVPNAYPDFLRWMPGADEVCQYDAQSTEADRRLEAADLIICTDMNEAQRIGALGAKMMERVAAGVPLLIVDHHPAVADRCVVDGQGILKLIYPDSPSASELVFRLIYQLSTTTMQDMADAWLNTDSATCLYTGMMTDTGNFSFNSNKAEMYSIVAELVRLGVDKDRVYHQVYNQYSAERMRLMGYCLYSKMKIIPEYHTALICLTSKELYKFNFHSGDAEGLVNLPLQIKDVYYSCFMREDKVYEAEKNLAGGENRKVKISMRSQGNRPVNTFCHDVYHGGGHINAAGGEYYGSMDDAVNAFMSHYQNYLKQD